MPEKSKEEIKKIHAKQVTPCIMTTLCYIEKDDAYLMLHRTKKENDINHDKWIGVGNVIVGQREGKTYDKAVADGWKPGETLFSIEEAVKRGTIVCMLLSDAGQMQVWPQIKDLVKAPKTSL